MGLQLREFAAWARNRKIVATLLMTVTLAIGMLIGTVISGRVGASHPAAGVGGTALAIPDPVQLSNAFASIVNKVQPAVVNISTTQVIEGHGKGKGGQQPRNHEDMNPPQDDQQQPFQDFFNRFFDFPDQGPTAERSLGSGVIVDKKGFILTNHHVVDQATKIQVYLNGEQTAYTAKVVGSDEETDLAVLKIEVGRDLPAAKLGNSDGVQVGDWSLAIGNPFGFLQGSVTAGIISAKDRGNVGQQFQRFIQTDAAINPGNSGGPLVDMAGQVIGINTAIITGGHGNEGVGFALPSNTAIGVYNQIISNGKVTRGSIGVSFTEAQGSNPIVLKELGAPYGIVLQRVEPGSPAEKAGLQSGDVITSVNGKPVHNGNDLVNPIATTTIGSTVRVTYVRDKKEHDASLTVADRTKIFPDRAGAGGSSDNGPTPAEFGLRLEDLGSDRAKRAGYENMKGVLVTEVDPASFAEDIGFGRGDVITEVNHVAVNSVAEYRSTVSGLKSGQDVLFKVLRRTGSDQFDTVYLAGAVPAPEQ
ncbi:MAG: Do family serine endopeptidase [Acidobacteriia bacterium]|nr:Do family serine endopeptidase [Terriglobia bacterium]